ncbi:hypothetical protein [Actinomadura harenae]|uniref:Uncharacterized protein n=1 Tax=Actinomadura harenae TaxID=2483351 RepID=A0A3M2LR39_9ACTN|nr:hypothetical protein [Actinomadura harenae]RMI39013.1 hypothetical protein EBO15_31120 [Actinomadura harenae]
MKLTITAEAMLPAWVVPAARTAAASAGLMYLHSTGTGWIATAVALAVGAGYGQMMSQARHSPTHSSTQATSTPQNARERERR